MGLQSHRATNATSNRVLYLCTTFPRLSETFVEREVRYLSTRIPLQIVSLWKGGRADQLNVTPIPLYHLLTLFFHLPYWLCRNPRGIARLLQSFFRRFPKSSLNFQETLLGMGMGVILARQVSSDPPLWIHGVWATAPATTAWTLYLLTGCPFSFGAHAYDLFQDGGDSLLAEKIQDAAWIRTSTKAAARELERRGAARDQVFLIRRGLGSLPTRTIPKETVGPMRLVSVGRLIPKKDQLRFVQICDYLRKQGVEFTAELIGEGPLRASLGEEIARCRLDQQVTLTGALPQEEVTKRVAGADLFLFTGKVSSDGDRDGLPNVLPEAMACGVPVLTSPIEGALEAIEDGKTGIVFKGEDPEMWAKQVMRLWDDHGTRKALSSKGRLWVETNFLSAINTSKLLSQILSSAGKTPTLKTLKPQ